MKLKRARARDGRRRRSGWVEPFGVWEEVMAIILEFEACEIKIGGVVVEAWDPVGRDRTSRRQRKRARVRLALHERHNTRHTMHPARWCRQAWRELDGLDL